MNTDISSDITLTFNGGTMISYRDILVNLPKYFILISYKKYSAYESINILLTFSRTTNTKENS